MQNLDDIAIENFREYLRIPSVHPNVDYEPCVKFFQKLAKDVGLEFNVCRNVPSNPHVILTWIGTQPLLPSIMLNSHMDVVPVSEKFWTHKPFGAEIDEKGNIYGRGAQDTKGVGMQYLEAVRRLKLNGYNPKRTIHIMYVSEEEVSGKGAMTFVKTDHFKNLNLGFGLDEGMAGTDTELYAFYTERAQYKFMIHCRESLSGKTPGEQVQHVLNKLYQFRLAQKNKKLEPGLQSSVNLTMLKGEVSSGFTLTFDGRILDGELDDFETFLSTTCKTVGAVVEDIMKRDKVKNTQLDDNNPFWMAMKSALKKKNLTIVPKVLMANSDSRSFRQAGVDCVGFSTNRNVELRVHGNDEYLSISSFLNGIQLYMDVISALSNV